MQLRICREERAPGHAEVSRLCLCRSLCCLRYLRQNNAPWNSSVCDFAARQGHLPVLQFAFDENAPRSLILLTKAGTHFACRLHTYPHLFGAAGNGKLKVLLWLLERGVQLSDGGAREASAAARGGHLEVTQCVL
jgi:hypothetical protein